MTVKIKTLLCALSFAANAAFALLLIPASRRAPEAVYVFNPGDGRATAAFVAGFPPGGSASFGPAEIGLRPGDKASLQFSLLSGKRQSNLLISALFDPEVVSARPTGYGVEITALRPGSTLMQYLTNDGVRSLALITVYED